VPRTKSAKKQMRQTKSHTARNRSQRSALRNALKKARAGGDSKEAVKLLDRAGRKNLIHKNTAARYKSQLARAAKVGAKK
jgi:small subunit ribosomal protein S20